ncbi:hypothetical protein SAMN05216383_10511 [Prevotella sp. KH2C16]|nr:hypothetical protein SAMN05216383_10511 [Prevotella sp. KH2C16]
MLPDFAQPLTIVRDPIVLLLVIQGLRKGLLQNNYCRLSIFVSILSFIISAFTDQTSLLVQYYGTRIFLLYFPAIFVIAKVFTLEDFYKTARFFLYLSVPMTILVIAQFSSPQSNWVNIGVGGDTESGGLAGTMGFFRPSGLFSFTQGFVCFQSFVVAYLLIYIYDKRAQSFAPIPKIMLLLILACYIISIPISISRTLFFQTIAALIFISFAILISRKGMGSMFKIVCTLVILIPLLMTFEEAQSFINVFLNRFSEAEEVEGDVIKGTIFNRYFGAFLRPWSLDVPFWGHGIGLGTRFGMNYSRADFFTDEEWTRIIYESGFLVGSIYIGLRLLLSLSLICKSIKQCWSLKYQTPMILLPPVLFLLPQGSWGNTTPLGFAVFAVATLLILLRKPLYGSPRLSSYG